MISKVEKLKKQIQEAEGGEVVTQQVKRKRLERSRADSSPEYEVAEEEDTASEDEDGGDFDQSESEAELGSSTARRKRQRASNASKLLAKTLFPPMKDLQVEIARLKMVRFQSSTRFSFARAYPLVPFNDSLATFLFHLRMNPSIQHAIFSSLSTLSLNKVVSQFTATPLSPKHRN